MEEKQRCFLHRNGGKTERCFGCPCRPPQATLVSTVAQKDNLHLLRIWPKMWKRCLEWKKNCPSVKTPAQLSNDVLHAADTLHHLHCPTVTATGGRRGGETVLLEMTSLMGWTRFIRQQIGQLWKPQAHSICPNHGVHQSSNLDTPRNITVADCGDLCISVWRADKLRSCNRPERGICQNDV